MIRPGNLLLLAGGVLFVGWFLLVRPTFLGGPASYVWVTGDSMEPALRSHDLVVAREGSTYGVGDIVAFHPPQHSRDGNAVVIHRIAGGSAEEGFVTQGDNNEARDPWRVSENDIMGAMWFRIPGAGHALAVLRGPVMLAGLAASIAVFLVMSGEEKKTKAPQASPSNAAGQQAPSPRSPRRMRRFRLPPGPMLLLALLAIGVAAVSFSVRQ